MELTSCDIEDLYLSSKDIHNYRYIQIPTELIANKVFSEISDTAKILYGLLLSRISLSMKNNMMDERKRYFVYYTIDNVMSDLNICRTKAKSIFKELTDIKHTGVDLVKKVRFPNKPSRIYVMNFSKALVLIESRMAVITSHGGL